MGGDYWRMQSHYFLLDDQGQSYDLRLDPPAVVCQAAATSVRRWRLARIANAFHATQQYCQRIEVLPGQPTQVLKRSVLDLSRNIRLTKQGRTASCRSCLEWSSAHAPMLASAMSGGQWPQARLASAERFAIQDNQCRLCRAAIGTLAHRYDCPASRPPDGWLKPDPDAEQIIADTAKD